MLYVNKTECIKSYHLKPEMTLRHTGSDIFFAISNYMAIFLSCLMAWLYKLFQLLLHDGSKELEVTLRQTGSDATPDRK